jgi:broad specificity phosphatase PhoE
VTDATVRLLLVRHAVTSWNREGRFQGHLDPPLSDEGRQEARRVGGRLAGYAALRPARLISSTLARAHDTATIIGAACGLDVEGDPRLIEIGQGDWEGRTHAELEAADPVAYAAWREGVGGRPPGGEPIETAILRVSAAMGAALAAGGGGPVCLVSHGGVLRLVAATLLDIDLERAWGLDVDNASLSVCSRSGSMAWQVERWNDTRHLLGAVTTHVDEAEGRPLAL